ncbi:hypothetical protein [Hydrocarboniclastica marina]|uniref:Uncharacterized protein n=1 Tax=Hydrocarboniclastica marina TaxID=2259620 RepID=A0A4P7XM57_9ALTE|nr:hypothetical protein [Hydrocarboniclastica marina]QCF28085.1 hypothetical protein soil367_18605 [Hydrocarboniclastica marina]
MNINESTVQESGLASLLDSIEAKVQRVHSDVSEDPMAEITTALLWQLHSACALDPQEAARRFGVSATLARDIANVPAFRFNRVIHQMSEKLLFSLSPSQQVIKAALESDNRLRSNLHLTASAYSNEYKTRLNAVK